MILKTPLPNQTFKRAFEKNIRRFFLGANTAAQGFFFYTAFPFDKQVDLGYHY